MRIILSNTEPSLKNYTWIKDISSLICHNVASVALDISDINTLFFEDSQAIASVLNLSNVDDILTQCGLTVKEKHLNIETCQGIIVAAR